MRTRNETYGSELGRTLSNQSVDILALELRDELLETLVVGLNPNSTEDLLDVRSRGGRVAANLEEEVCSEVTHLWGSREDVQSHPGLRRRDMRSTHSVTFECLRGWVPVATNHWKRALREQPTDLTERETASSAYLLIPREDLWILSEDDEILETLRAIDSQDTAGPRLWLRTV